MNINTPNRASSGRGTARRRLALAGVGVATISALTLGGFTAPAFAADTPGGTPAADAAKPPKTTIDQVAAAYSTYLDTAIAKDPGVIVASGVGGALGAMALGSLASGVGSAAFTGLSLAATSVGFISGSTAGSAQALGSSENAVYGSLQQTAPAVVNSEGEVTTPAEYSINPNSSLWKLLRDTLIVSETAALGTAVLGSGAGSVAAVPASMAAMLAAGANSADPDVRAAASNVNLKVDAFMKS